MSRSNSGSPRRSPRRSRSPKGPTSLLVRNLVGPRQDYKVSGDELKAYYAEIGEVRDVYLPRDYCTNRPRGFGFVEFQNQADAKKALETTDGVEVLGSTVKVVFAREGRKTVLLTQPNEMRSRDRRSGRRSPRRRSPRR